MPFTLAHPIAVLPLARQRVLPFSALVIGSMTPDFSHILIGSWRHYRTAHSFQGAFTLDLPVGIATFIVFHAFVKLPVLSLLPARHADVLYPVARTRWSIDIRTALAVVAALLIGSFTHIAMDDCTHSYGYFVRCIPALGIQKPMMGLPIFKLLQYGISVFGVIGLGVAYSRWWARQPRPPSDKEPFSAAELLQPIPARRAQMLGLLALIVCALFTSIVFATCTRHGIRPHLAPRKFVSDIICGMMAWICAAAVVYAAAWNYLHHKRRPPLPGN